MVLEELLRRSGVESHSRVLEVGCGTGNYIIGIEKKTGCRCWGVDPSESMLAYARARSDTIRFAAGTAERLKFPDGAFDFVFTVYVIRYIDRPQDYFNEAYRVLAPGGRLCTYTAINTPKDIRRNPDVLSRYFWESDGASRTQFPTTENLVAYMRGAGFRNLSQVHCAGRSVTTNILYAVRMIWTVPELRMMPREKIARGLARLERDLAKGPIRVEQPSLFAWATK